MEKDIKYQALINDVREHYKNYGKGGKDFSLGWIDECEEINLWTYWQGGGNLNPKILVLGQDFGCALEKGSTDTKVIYKDIILGGSEKYIESIQSPSNGNDFPTDRFLQVLLSSLADGDEYNPYIPNNRNLFFSNLCLGYRDNGSTGGLFTSELTNPEVIDFNRRLIEILEPKVVICLGKLTYESLVKGLGLKLTGDFYSSLRAKTCHVTYGRIEIFGQAHTGSRGKTNRWYAEPKHEPKSYSKEEVEDLYKDDWAIIKKYL